MKDFFLILFFSKVVVLTPGPIDIVDSVTLQLGSPISAVTEGAQLRIDVSEQMSEQSQDLQISSILERLRQRFPSGSLSARLITPEGEELVLDTVSGATDGSSAELILSSSNGVKTNLEFTQVKIVTSRELRCVTISWQNYSH
jgi:hypothetical protein